MVGFFLSLLKQKLPQRCPKRGGGQGHFWTMSKRKQLFFQDYFPREVDGGEGAASLGPAARTPYGGKEGGEEGRGGGVYGGGAGRAYGGSRATVTEVVLSAAGGDWQGAGQLAAAAAGQGVSNRLLER